MYYINKALLVTFFSMGCLAFSGGLSAEPSVGVQSASEISSRDRDHRGHHRGHHHRHHNWDRWDRGSNWGIGFYQPYYYSYPRSSTYYYSSDPYYYYDNSPYYNTRSGVSLRFGF